MSEIIRLSGYSCSFLVAQLFRSLRRNSRGKVPRIGFLVVSSAIRQASARIEDIPASVAGTRLRRGEKYFV